MAALKEPGAGVQHETAVPPHPEPAKKLTNEPPPARVPEVAFAVRISETVPVAVANQPVAGTAAPSKSTPLAPAAPMEAPTAPKTNAVNEVTFRVHGANDASAVIRIVERSGEIRVSVHAAEPELTASLRSNVSDLKTSLESAGWNAEVWKPRVPSEQDAPSSLSQQEKPAGEPPQHRNQPQRPRQPGWLDALEEDL